MVLHRPIERAALPGEVKSGENHKSGNANVPGRPITAGEEVLLRAES
jgi:hypothetical protein